MNPYYNKLLVPDKEGISISSLLGDDKDNKEPTIISLDSSPEQEEDTRKQEPAQEPKREDDGEQEPKRALRRSTRMAIDSMVSKDPEPEKPKPAPRARKPRVTKKKTDEETNSDGKNDQLAPQPVVIDDKNLAAPQAHTQLQEPKQHAEVSPVGMKPNIMNLMNSDAPAPAPLFPPMAHQHLPPMNHYQNQIHKFQASPQPPTEQIPPVAQVTQAPAFVHHQVTPSVPSQTPRKLISPEPTISMTGSPILPTQAGSQVMRPVIFAPPNADVSQPKAKPGRKRKADAPASASGAAPVKKGKKKATTTTVATTNTTTSTPEVEEVPFTEIMNKSLKQPNPESSLPPPTILDIAPSSTNTPTENNDKPSEEPIIALHVPLKTPTEGPGSAQVVFNVMKMCEDKYGWKTVHPHATKFMFNDDDLDDDDDDMEDDDEEEKEKDKEPKEPVKVDGRKLQKGKPKIGQYDINDPFIDDTEMLWEEQRASTKDGFFVFWGPLIEEGTSARIERADGTIKRGRKKTGATTTTTKKKPIRQQTPKATNTPKTTVTQRKLAPLPLAPLPVLPKP